MAYQCDQKEYSLLSLSDLYIDENIADMVELQSVKFPDYLLSNLQSTNLFKLSQERLNSILKAEEGQIPPIDVCLGLGGKKYDVLNGRHRVCAAILSGDNTIRAIIQVTL